nr:integrase, catalytic region, zinc finger, CCHC-type, peptidase aspartic, catalytic [Tanacetum cinerariifolium]
MANLSKDIQCIGSDTRPHMLDRTDFASWQQRIRLYSRGKENGVELDKEQLLFIAGGQENAVDDDVDEQPVQDLALSVDNVFQADDCDAFDSDDAVYEHHEVHEMHDDVQPNYSVESHADYTSDNNMISYDQYVKDNAVLVVQNNVSFVPNDAYLMILNDMHEQPVQLVSVTIQNNVVDKSLTAELATYKEQVELYERRDKFELTKREQNIDEQLRIVITGHNIKEENLKKPVKRELHQRVSLNGKEVLNKQRICYLTKVIPFFKTLKEHFEGIQKAITTKIKEMKAIFDELEAEVDQNVVNRKCDKIERKSLLTENDTLIANYLSKEVIYIAMNSELNVSRFSEMHDAHTVVQARCLELKTE